MNGSILLVSLFLHVLHSPAGSLVGSAPGVGALMGPPAQIAKRKILPMVFKVSQGRRPEGGGAARAVPGALRSGPGQRKGLRVDQPVDPPAPLLQAFPMLFGHSWRCRIIRFYQRFHKSSQEALLGPEYSTLLLYA